MRMDRIAACDSASVCALECYNFRVREFLEAHESFIAPAHVGEWLSLVEHLVRDQGVGGSNPLSPTNLSNT